MSKIDNLIQELCPDGVEYKKLNEVCRFQNGFAFKARSFVNEGIPVVRIGDIQNGKIQSKSFAFISESAYQENLSTFFVEKNEIVIAMSGATTGKVGINTTGLRLLQNQRVGKFIPSMKYLNNGFLYHYLLTQEKLIYRIAGGGAQPNLSSNKLMCLSIPVPPIEVQEEIVRVLNSFAELEEELEEELEARRRQYAYYRDQLLTFNKPEIQRERELLSESIKWKALNDISEIKSGSFVKKDLQDDSFEYPVMNGGIAATGFYRDYNFEGQSIALSSRGANCGAVNFMSSRFWAGNSCFVITPNDDSVLVKYLYYVLTSEIPKEIERKKQVAGIPALNLNPLGKTLIPLPPLSEQQRIVDILDKFDALVNDISQGLPAEIEARRKQYEYYRDKLLTFKKKEV